MSLSVTGSGFLPILTEVVMVVTGASLLRALAAQAYPMSTAPRERHHVTGVREGLATLGAGGRNSPPRRYNTGMTPGLDSPSSTLPPPAPAVRARDEAVRE